MISPSTYIILDVLVCGIRVYLRIELRALLWRGVRRVHENKERIAVTIIINYEIMKEEEYEKSQGLRFRALFGRYSLQLDKMCVITLCYSVKLYFKDFIEITFI